MLATILFTTMGSLFTIMQRLSIERVYHNLHFQGLFSVYGCSPLTMPYI